MSLKNLDNLVRSKQLKLEPFNEVEYKGLINSGKARLNDSANTSLAAESRFDLAYNAAHALALAALRKLGYRPSNRYIVFQILPDTLGVGPEVWRILAKCHDIRNTVEYEGYQEIDERLLNELVQSTQYLFKLLIKT